MTTNTNNSNLDKLFSKAKEDSQHLDDFEREAMAGFELLTSQKEALELKSSLDDRIQQSLFNNTEKNRTKIYWFAAAGLFLIIGLSTFFVLNTNLFFSSQNNLAVTDAKHIPESNLNELPSKEQDQIIDKKPNNAHDVIAQQNKQELSPKTTSNEEVNENNASADNKILERPASVLGEKSEPFIGDYPSGKVTEKASSFKTDNTSKDVLEEQKKGLLDERSKFSEDETKEYKQIDLASSSPQEKMSGNVIVGSPKAVVVSSQNEEKIVKAKSQSRKDKKVVSKESAAESEQSIEASSTDLASMPISNEAVKTSASNFINCYYTGGEPAVTKDIREKLISENLNQKFDVIVYVNENKIVKDVSFIESYNLTKHQKQDISKILKSLNKFNFTVNPTEKGLYSYKINYRP